MNNHSLEDMIENEKKQKKRYSIPSRMARSFVAITMCSALIVTGLTAAIVNYSSLRKDDLIIVLDPGHGGSDTGATNDRLGLCEAAINLKIALACRDRLQQYKGVRVYMTHTGVKNTYGKSSLSSRVNVAGEVGADILISLHINDASSRSANGAEVYVPVTKHEAKYNEQCTKLAENIIDNLTALGLKSRGVKTRASGGGRVYKFSDGATEKGDYYYVIGETISRFGIPGILVEHAFIQGDSDFLDSDSDLAALGTADADGIAKHYDLRLKPEFKSEKGYDSYSVSSDSGNSASAEPTISSEDDYTSEEDESSELNAFESMVKALPDSPTSSDANQITAIRTAYNSLSDISKSQLSPELYQRMYNAVTSYENSVRPIRFALKDGSQLSIDRFNGKLLHTETAKERSGKVTVLSVTVELELYIEPNSPEQYKNDGALTCRVISQGGKELEQIDEISEGSVISLLYNDTLLDSLIISLK